MHTILRLHLEDFIDERQRQGAPLPAFVLGELRGYLQCGLLSAACARFECEDCGLVRVTALSCKGRGFCPRCCGRRMSERARHLAARVFPEGVPVRQWVLSLPFELRVRAAFDHELALALCRITTRAIESHYRLAARRAGLRAPRGGSVTLIQRFGSDLRTNLHFHSLCLDGVYVGEGGAPRRFFTPPAPSPEDVERVLARIVRKARTYLASRDEVAPADDEELALAQTHAASARTRGAQKHAPDDAPEPRCQVLLP
ncbi:transposase zinc-binding domain-containing protein, partial [bacterium AH-315-N03]|nr:transposase zinc-binding domain-containing protein [bacterium AH-315-N03]